MTCTTLRRDSFAVEVDSATQAWGDTKIKIVEIVFVFYILIYFSMLTGTENVNRNNIKRVAGNRAATEPRDPSV